MSIPCRVSFLLCAAQLRPGYRAAPWLIAQEIDIADPAEFNRDLKQALANGQTAVYLGEHNVFDTVDDVGAAFADVDLGSVPLLLAGEERAVTTYGLLKDYLGESRISNLRGCLGFDPLHGLAEKGVLNADAFARMAAYVVDAQETSPALRSIAGTE